jgi:cobalt-zinc-cadmium efflux system membrane fusion protein
VTSEKEYLEAKQYLAEMRIALRSAEQKLHALGFSDVYLKKLPDRPDATFTHYELAAPFSATVIEKHITLGEVFKDDTEAFVIADLSTVWVDLNVYQKDLPYIRKGQSVIVTSGLGIPDVSGQIAYLGPVVAEKTRTVLARVILPNPDGLLRPGLFVNGKVAVDNREAALLVRKTAIQTIEDKPVIFIQDEDGFEPRSIVIGRSDALNAEIISGISAGQRYVAKGAFTLKAQLAKGSFDSGHNH